MSILVDTAVWIDHFRRSNDALVNLVSLDMAVTHPMVIVELACGTPPAPRAQTLGDMALLASAQQATLGEAQEFIEREKLYGLGCGLVNIALLASAIITPNTQLWTMNKRLSDLAQRFGVAYQPSLHYRCEAKMVVYNFQHMNAPVTSTNATQAFAWPASALMSSTKTTTIKG